MTTDSSAIRSILEKPTRLIAPSDSPADIEPESDYQAYAQGRVSRRPQLTLSVRQPDGSARVFAYSYLYAIESSEPGAGFTLDFSQHKVKIEGRNLQILFRYLCQHRVAEIRVASRTQCFEISDEEPVVDRVEVSAT